MKPILFNTAMVQAILEGRKTTTRRVIKNVEPFGKALATPKGIFSKKGLADHGPYKIGDILYVRETWMISNPMGDIARNDRTAEYYYKAGFAHGKRISITQDQQKNLGVWKPSIHMPKEAARIFLKVTDVRVEQLRYISAGECRAEGIDLGYKISDSFIASEYCNAFGELWDSTLKKDQIDKYGWNANPWVWVIEFERIEKSEVEQ